MAKFYGKIGFTKTIETEPGIWVNDIIEKTYIGEVLNSSIKYQKGEQINDDITLSKRISIICDIYISDNLHFLKYVVYMGTKWTIKEFDIQYPRIILTLGGVYNG